MARDDVLARSAAELRMARAESRWLFRAVVLNAAIRNLKQKGAAVLIMARPAAIQECDLLLMLEGGARRAFGPKEDVLREMVANHKQIALPGQSGGVT